MGLLQAVAHVPAIQLRRLREVRVFAQQDSPEAGAATQSDRTIQMQRGILMLGVCPRIRIDLDFRERICDREVRRDHIFLVGRRSGNSAGQSHEVQTDVSTLRR